MKANVSQVSGIKTIVFGVKMKVSFSQSCFVFVFVGGDRQIPELQQSTCIQIPERGTSYLG